MMKRKIRYGIVGAGGIAVTHAAALAAAKNSELAAICDNNRERAAKFAAQYNIKSYDCLENFLDNREIDAVTIAVPSGLHAEIAIPSAVAKKHILCEKPLDVTVEKAETIIQACRQNNVLLSTVFQLRFSPVAQKIKQALDAGLFGRIVQASARIKWFRPQSYYDDVKWRGSWAVAGGGALMTQGIHDLDLLIHLNGDPAEVCAFTDTLTHAGIEVEDNAVAAVRWKNGAIGVIEASTSCNPPFPRRLEINGERGSVVLEDNKIIRWDLADEIPAAESSEPGGGASDPTAISSDGHRRQIEDLSQAILDGADSVRLSGEEALRSLHFICGIYESANTGKIINFN